METKVITLIDGTKVCVPNTLNLITSYVLEEQLDWFEDEIKFMRRVISIGDNIIDIGANYGVYTLAASKILGSSGQIYSFEPAKSTAAMLSESIKINNYENIKLVRKGLSNKEDSAYLSLNENSELNAVEKFENITGNYEEIQLTTLDICKELFDWQQIDFIKIDAEGEEKKIIEGGLNFFKMQSPLVMFEIKEGKNIHLDLVNIFEGLNYKVYRLIPGLNILAPWSQKENVDGYLLNLFCCKDDKSKKLHNKGMLTNVQLKQDSFEDINLSENEIETNLKLFKINFKNFFPLAYSLHEKWDENINSIDLELINSLNTYQLSREEKLVDKRYELLCLSFNSIKKVCQKNSGSLRLLTLSRVAKELGFRELAVKALDILIKNIEHNGSIHFGEPFLLPYSDFELIEPNGKMLEFIWSTLLISIEKMQAFSSYYTGDSTMYRLNEIIDAGFADEEIIRRKNLIQTRYSINKNL